MTRFITRLALEIIVLLAAASASHAENHFWSGFDRNPASGFWNATNFWLDNTVPGTSDTATFDLALTYMVTLNNPPPVIQGLTVTGGAVTFNGNNPLNINSGGGQDLLVSGGSLTLGTSGSSINMNIGDDLRVRGDATMFANFGSHITTTDLVLGASTAPAGVGKLTIDGDGSFLNVSALAQVGSGGETGTLTVRNNATANFNGTLSLGVVGSSSTGNLVVTSGGAITTANIGIGADAFPGQTGTMLVGNGGVTSTVTQSLNATLIVGASGGGAAFSDSLTIAPDGSFISGSGTGTITVNPTGIIYVTDEGKLNARGNVTIDGGRLKRENSGNITLAPSKTMTIQNAGTFVVTGDYNADAAYVVTGGSSWTNSGELRVGVFGTGTLLIEQGGVVSSASGVLGKFAGGNGEVTVTGSLSTWTTSGLIVGGDVQPGGTGYLNVLNGGHVQANGNVKVWENGAIDIQSLGTFNANGNVTVNGGALTRFSGGTFSLAAGKTLTVENGGLAQAVGDFSTASNATYNITGTNIAGIGSRLDAVAGGNLRIINGATVNVSSGGSLFADTVIQVGFGFSDGTDGTLIVDGLGSSATTPGSSAAIWGHAGSTATVTFRNNASGSFSQVSLAHSTTAGTTGIVTVQTGADLTFTNNLFLAALGGATTSATLSVQGNGSTVTQIGGSTTVGHSATGTAAINIGTAASGAIFDTGTGTTTINKTGTVTIGSASTSGTLKADGNVTIDGGLLQVGSGSSVIVAAGKTMTLVNGGTFQGSGSVTGNVQNGGVVSPGTSSGTLSLTRNYTQIAAGQLLIELASASSFDKLVINGSAALAGTLDVDLLGGFIPQPGTAFQIISSSGGVSGTFGSPLLPALTGANWQLRYNPNSVSLQVALLGDYNFNGTVDAADYVVWRKSLGQTGIALLADGNGNGQIDTGDYNVWRSHFGQTAGSGSAHAASDQLAVPEPTQIWLLLVAAATFVRRFR